MTISRHARRIASASYESWVSKIWMGKAWVGVLFLALPCQAHSRHTLPAKTRLRARWERAESRKSKEFYAGTIIRTVAGWNLMKPSELNATMAGAFSSRNLDLGSAGSFGVAIEYPVVTPGLYAGLRVEHFSTSSGPVQIASNSNARARSDLSGTPMMLTGTYLYPWMRDFQIGATLGFGMALDYQTSVEISNSDLPNAENGKLRYAGAPFAGLVAATAAFDLSRRVGVRFETGYRILSSHNMTATSSYGNIHSGDTLATHAGHPLRVDASAFYSGFSLSMKL